MNNVICFIMVLGILFCGCLQSDKTRYLEIWDIAHEEGLYEEAISEFTNFIKERPDNEWTTCAQLQMGDCFLYIGNEEKARECFESVIEINWNQCTTNQATGCIEHLNSHHENRYPLHESGRCPLCRRL